MMRTPIKELLQTKMTSGDIVDVDAMFGYEINRFAEPTKYEASVILEQFYMDHPEIRFVSVNVEIENDGNTWMNCLTTVFSVHFRDHSDEMQVTACWKNGGDSFDREEPNFSLFPEYDVNCSCSNSVWYFLD